MEISTILAQIDIGSMALPEFQRGYVWNRDQVRSLMFSLYRRYPVGSLMVWLTKTETADVRGDGPVSAGSVKLLLDGQQRMTSLYGIIRGNPPRFFDGNAQTFTGLYFYLKEEIFEFYAPLRMKGNPLWISVTEVMQTGAGVYLGSLFPVLKDDPDFPLYMDRLNKLDRIKTVDLHIEEVAGVDKTTDVVVDIFNRVNSGGTKLSKGDLALAKICAEWPAARDELKTRLGKWRAAGFDFRLDWLLRNINAVITGEALFSALRTVTPSQFSLGLANAEKSIDYLLNMIGSRLGLDNDAVLGGPACFPLMARYVMQSGGHVTDHKERDKLLYWYVHTFLWGRYAGSTETILNQDLDAIEDKDGALDRLIALLRQNRGDLRLYPNDFRGWNTATRFYPLLYMLTRVNHARDWATGIELANSLLGKQNKLQVHHIFPKAVLYKHGYSRADVNALANYAFLTQETNLLISDRLPTEYMPKFAAKHPGALESGWIPMDACLWEVDRYKDFLAARRDLLARAANTFLDGLLVGALPEIKPAPAMITLPTPASEPVIVSSSGNKEEAEVEECDSWVIAQGLPKGEYMYELLDPATNEVVAVLDLAWPNGLQEGYSHPVAFVIDADRALEHAMNKAGYLCFTGLAEFQEYVSREVLAMTI